MLYVVSAVASLLSGCGIGGGATFLIFVMLFDLISLDIARAYNLLLFCSIGICIFFKEAKNKKIITKEYIFSIFLMIIGCVAGIIINHFINEKILKIIFYIFMILLGIYECFSAKNNSRKEN